MIVVSKAMRATSLRRARASIKDAMMPLMSRAKREGLMLKPRWGDRLFTPVELERQWTIGTYIWGPTCWTLVNERGERVL